MSFAIINNVSIRGISACVPAHIEENLDIPVFKEGEAPRVIAQTGIERKHTIEPKSEMTASDLCVRAYEELISKMGWDASSIDLLVFVSSVGDYVTPPTANVLHGKLGLPESCMCFDIRQGCPGWVVGLNVVASMVSSGNFKRAILLCGEASTLMTSELDKETRPLFGDAGTATALEYDVNAAPIEFEDGSRGKDFAAIITPKGGLRNPVTPEDLEFKEYGENLVRRGIDCMMDGMGVFAFGISVAPKSVKRLVEHFDIDLDEVDYFLFHQANQYMNTKIAKKLKLPLEKVPTTLRDFGNNSCASIPLTIVAKCNEEYSTKQLTTIANAFGVGLAWGSCHFKTKNIVCPPLIFI